MILREMLVDDLDQVMEIEEELFSVPWTKEGFLTFLMKENGMFLVVEEKGRILVWRLPSWRVSVRERVFVRNGSRL